MSVELLDCTLRDGTYVNDAFFGFDTVKNIIKDLSESNIDVIECGWLKNVLFEKDKTILDDYHETFWTITYHPPRRLRLRQRQNGHAHNELRRRRRRVPHQRQPSRRAHPNGCH